MNKDYVFYVCDHNVKDAYDFYGVRTSLTEANKLVDFLETKGFNTFWTKDTMGYEWETHDYTKPIKEYYFDKPLILLNEIAKHVKTTDINDLTTAQYAFYEGHITFKEYNQIVKVLKERSN